MNQGLISALLIVVIAVTTVVADDMPRLKITTKRENDRVEVKSEGDKVVLMLHSPFGISNVIIERTGETWPDSLVLRLHLKGLENLSITNEKKKLEASVSSQDGKVRLWVDGQEDLLLDATSPYWMEIRMVGSDGKTAKTIPLKDGYFEMKCPKRFFEGNPKSINVNWIDFYRN